MSEWKDRKGVVVPLGLLATTVWAYVLYTLVAAWPSAEPEPLVSSLRPPRVVEAVTHVWQDDFRDPFSATVRSEAPVPHAQQNVSTTPDVTIRMRLVGVVDGTAMVETASGVVVLAIRGDSIDGVRVIEVTSSTVKLRHRGRTVTLSLDTTQQ